MKRSSAFLKALLLAGMFLVLDAPSPEAVAQTTQAKPETLLSFERITTYLKERDGATTLQNNRSEKELTGRLFSGVVLVWDVVEEASQIIIKGDGGGGGYYGLLHFKVQDATIKEKATQIRKLDRIFVTARLKRFWVRGSGYINVRDTYVAEFNDLQALDVQPKKEPEPKK